MSNTVYHGGRLDIAMAQYGGERADWLDLSTGINPNAYPVPTLDQHVWERLPEDRALSELLDAARAFYKVPPEVGLVAAPGTQALIEMMPKVLPCKQVAIMAPTYGEHAHTWRKGGVHVEFMTRGEAIPRFSNAVVVVNPNNPDTAVHSTTELLALASEMRTRHGYLIVDEAFCDPVSEHSIIPDLPENMYVYRSFGKFFGLAGLRLGFLIGGRDVIHRIENLLGPWSVAGPALEIGRQALSDENWISATRVALAEMASRQAAVMQEAGLEICGINALFIYAGHEETRNIFEALAEQKILVRPFPDIA